MELEWKTCPMGIVETVQETVADNPFDLDVQLPDYAPDIHHVLRAAVTPQIHAVNVSEDRAQAEGVGVLRMLYATEGGNLAAAEQTFPIRRMVPMPPDASQMQVSVSASTDYVNCRASGQRRASVHGVVSVRFTMLRKRDMLIPAQPVSPDVQTRTRSLQTLHTTAFTERIFAMSEVVECAADAPPIASIVGSRAVARLDATRAVQDKLLLKGEVNIQSEYLPQQDAETTAVFQHTMPLSQVIEATGAAETDLQDVRLTVLSAETTPKPDGSGENRLMEVTLQIAASVRCCAPQTLCVIEDAYSTTQSLQGRYTESDWDLSSEKWSDSFSAKAQLEWGGTDMRTILLSDAVVTRQSLTQQGDTLEIVCTAAVDAVGRDEDGTPVHAEKTMDFTVRKLLSDPQNTWRCTPTVAVTQCRIEPAQDGTAQVQLDGWIDGTIYTAQRVRYLCDAQCTPLPDDQSPAAMTIYFADAGESVWDIARRYRTTTQAVCAENGLSDEMIPEQRMLLIPAAE